MSKPLLRLGFTDTHDQIIKFFSDIFSKHYVLVIDNNTPDYLIFGDRNFGQDNLRYNDKNCIKIFYTGENQRAWDYQAHYAITFDHIDSEKHYRLPLYVVYDWDNKRKGLDTYGNYERVLNEKTEFCSFVVRNPNCQKRNEFFNKLSQYKQITSAGPLFNNAGYVLEYGENAMKAKQEYLRKFKFNMCFENSSYPGYATEKLYEAYYGGTIPIYWGSPTIDCDFNPKAFLNWHNYQNDEDFIEAIKRLDNDSDLYAEMYNQPLVLNDRYFNLDNFYKWFNRNVYKGVINTIEDIRLDMVGN
jgi:hypothetical protein